MQATTRGALLRGTETEDSFGDPIDDNLSPLLSYTEWDEQRRNFIQNPRGVAGGAPSAADHLGVTSYVNDFPGDVETAIRWTRTVDGAARARGLRMGADMPAGGVAVGFRARVRVSDACQISLSVRPNMGSTTGQSSLGTRNLPAGTTEITASGLTIAGAAGSSSGVMIVANAGQIPIGGWLDVTAADFEIGGVPADSLDGWGLTDETQRRRWLSTPDASASVLETRELLADYSDFPLGLTERSRREQDPASGLWSTVRYLVGRVPWRVGAIIEDGDRIRDNRTGLVYQLDEMRRTPRSISGHSSVTLNLRRAGG